MSRDGREARKQDGTRMRHAIKHPVVHNVPTNNLIVRWRAIIIRISLAASTATFNCYSATVRELFAPCFSQTRFRDRIKNIKISSPSFRF